MRAVMLNLLFEMTESKSAIDGLNRLELEAVKNRQVPQTILKVEKRPSLATQKKTAWIFGKKFPNGTLYKISNSSKQVTQALPIERQVLPKRRNLK